MACYIFCSQPIFIFYIAFFYIKFYWIFTYSIAILRKYASSFLVDTCFFFSSIKVRSSFVTRNLICTFLFLLFIGGFPFCFYRGFGTFPKGLHQPARVQAKSLSPELRRIEIFTERVPLSYACYPLISITTVICLLPKIAKKKCCIQ